VGLKSSPTGVSIISVKRFAGAGVAFLLVAGACW
jgi:hypothetical protein